MIIRERKLEEALVDTPQEVIDELISILGRYGFVLDPAFKTNPGKTLFGNVHLQVINKDTYVNVDDGILYDDLKKYIPRALINDIDELSKRSDCPITWSFGANSAGQVTAGLDISKQYIPDEEDVGARGIRREAMRSRNNKNKKLTEGAIYRFNGEEFTSREDAEAAVENYAEDSYDDMLNEVYGEVDICGIEYDASIAFYRVDPIAYNVGLSDYSSSLYDDIEEDWEDEEVSIHVTDIEWDIDEDDEVDEDLPTEYDVDIEIEEGDTQSDINDKIQEVLENEFGWSVNSLSFDYDLDESIKPLKERPYYELSPRYDSRKSFYGKAHVDTGDNDDKNKLWSYDTLVAEIKDGKPVVYGTYSATTLRHIKDWLKQNGFKAETAKQIMQDYGVTESLHEGWRGSDVIEMDYRGDWADPDLVYDGYTFNYWDIEDALWDMFLEETGYGDDASGNLEAEEEFSQYIRDNAPAYLDDVIGAGYFANGSKSWHDRY